MAGLPSSPILPWFCSLSLLFSHSLSVLAVQGPSTTMALPPLQWINLTGLVTGQPPTPRSGSSIGYDEGTRSLLIFGGDTAPNSPTQDTYILNLDSLTWSQPSPSVSLQDLLHIPPRRSQAFGGVDIVGNARESFILFGGEGSDGQPLDDIWSYDFVDHFWVKTSPSSKNNPSSRWIGAGGTDSVRSVQNPTQANFQNTLYVFGGTNAQTTDALSDAWALTIDGNLSPNNVGSAGGITASWKSLGWPSSLPQKVGQASTILPGGVLAVYGGCNSTSSSNINTFCASQDAYILDPTSQTTLSPPSFCPAPRLSGSLTANYNGFSSAFSTQTFLLFGAFDHNGWNDSDGSQNGEVAVLDTSSLLWSRVLPSGDPGPSGGTQTFPGSRQGAAVFSWTTALVGGSRSSSSDTIVFGGQDPKSGDYLSDLWILRAYNGVITGSNQKWSGFGDGKLQSGVNSSGEGVTMEYLKSCAIPIQTSGPSASSTKSAFPSGTSAATGSTSAIAPSVSISHKVIQPFSLAVLLLAATTLRFYSPGLSARPKGKAIFMTSTLFGLVSFVSSIAGIVLAFTSTSASSQPFEPQTKIITLDDHHGLAGLILFICLQSSLVLGALFAILWLRSCRRNQRQGSTPGKQSSRSGSHSPRPSSVVPSQGDRSSNVWLRARTQSAGESSRMASPWPLLGGNSGRRSESDERLSAESEPQSRGFEVVNRPKHLRSRTAHLSPEDGQALPRTLSEISWLERRRSLNAIGELDYAISQSAHERQLSQTQTHYENQNNATPVIEDKSLAEVDYIRPWTALRILQGIFHLCLLGNLAFALASLFQLGNHAGFAVFLIWCIIAYSIIIWGIVYQPKRSLVPLLQDQFLEPQRQIPPAETSPLTDMLQHPSSPLASPTHYQSAPSIHYTSIEYPPSTSIYPQPRHVEPDPDDDEDDEEKQFRMEQEMQRRDVSIVTVPRRQLRITNV